MSKVQVFSSGGGTQSCYIAALIVQGRLPKPDICVIADTGYENHRTWEYMDKVIAPALAGVGCEIHRVSAREYAAPWGRDVFAGSGQLMIPAYTDMSGVVGKLSKLSTYCSNAWKQEVVDRWLSKERGITRSHYVKWIGFIRDEVKRVFRMAKGEEYQKGLIRFPLIADVPTTRHLKRNDIAGDCEVRGCGKPARFRSDRPCIDDGDGGSFMDICVGHYFKWRKEGEL